MGKRGSYVCTGTEEIHVPAYEVDVVDATGAGDAYVAGFLAGTVMGWDLKRTRRTCLGSGRGMRNGNRNNCGNQEP